MDINIAKIIAIKELANSKRDELFDSYEWEKKLPFTDGDIRIILKAANDILSIGLIV